MLVLLGFAFISGLVTILAPCIWPLLPIIVSSAIAGTGHKRPLGITLGIMVSFATFTLSISYLVSIFNLDANLLRLVSVVIMVALGLVMLVPVLSRVVEGAVSRLSSRWGRRGQTGSGFSGGFVAGFSLGIVWAPCAGPILATIATLAATGKVTLNVVLITIAYVVGVGIPLFIFAYGGQKFVHASRTLSPYTARIQQVFGLVMIIAAIGIYTNYDKVLQVKLLNLFPNFSSALTRFENSTSVVEGLNDLTGTETRTYSADLFNINEEIAAPEFAGITKWLNSDAVTMEQLKGKVVLVDFWTYTCINCIRTLPHVTGWYEKYKDQGFVVIGVHTPEFEFEKNTDNVQQALTRYNIHYPVAQDNDYGTWSAYSNRYWPAEYLIDAKGNVRRAHFGEGEYDKMEEAIQALLAENGKTPPGTLSTLPAETQTGGKRSPETYLGSKRMEYYYPGGHLTSQNKTFTLNEKIPLSNFSLGGQWNVGDEQSITGKDAVLSYNFTADKVFLVLRPGKATRKVRVYLDGKEITADVAGADVKNGVVTVDQDRLYNLVDLHGKPGQHLLRLEFEAGTEVFAFTFG